MKHLPAFPAMIGLATVDNNGHPLSPSDIEQLDQGMTLRDYFASQALAGDFSAQNEHCGAWRDDVPDDQILGRVKFYYRFADAMMKGRA